MNFLLIGKPNVGKSSIYNILTSSKNIIHKEEGTTRDWHKSKVKSLNNVIIYDTPGIILKKNKINKLDFSDLLKLIDKFIYVIDYKNKIYENEIESINQLRKFNKEIVLIINKDDNHQKNINTNFFGIKSLFFISCSHKLGFDDLYEFFEKFDQDIANEYQNVFFVNVKNHIEPSSETMLDHIHPTNEGSKKIANIISNFIIKLPSL